MIANAIECQAIKVRRLCPKVRDQPDPLDRATDNDCDDGKDGD